MVAKTKNKFSFGQDVLTFVSRTDPSYVYEKPYLCKAKVMGLSKHDDRYEYRLERTFDGTDLGWFMEDEIYANVDEAIEDIKDSIK